MTYDALVQDLRALHPQLHAMEIQDITIARTLWRAFTQLVAEAADLAGDDPRIPSATSTLDIPTDLTAGFTIPKAGDPAMLKPRYVEVRYGSGGRALVNLVSAGSRFHEVEPLPAAYLAGSILQPIPGSSHASWTHESIQTGDWNDLAAVVAEYVPEPAEPADETAVVDVSAAFHWAGIYSAARHLAATHARDALAAMNAGYEEAFWTLMQSLGMPPRSRKETVVSVW